MPKTEKRLPFSKQRLAALPTPAKGRVYFHDEKQAGLCLCVTQSGTRTFYLYRWVHGRPSRVRIGKFPEVTVDHARDEARRLVGQIASGRDPQTERVAKRGEPTVGQAWEHWLAWATPRNRKSSIETKTTKYNLYVKPWEHRRLSSITPEMVAKWHAAIGSETFKHGKKDKKRRGGPVAANHALVILASLFNRGADIGFKGDNPCAPVEPFPTQTRERFLQADEVGPFLEACASQPQPWRDYWPMCLWTGARRMNVASMRWQSLDLDRRLWFLSAEETKTGRPQVITLPLPAVEILKRRLAENFAESEWVFPLDHPCGHISRNVDHYWQPVLERSGIKGLVPHDLRRTLGSWQALSGSSLQVIGKSLGHSSTASTEIYARLLTDSVRTSVDVATAAILAAAKKEEG